MARTMKMTLYLKPDVKDEFALAGFIGSMPPYRRQEMIRRALIAGLKAEGVDLDRWLDGYITPPKPASRRRSAAKGEAPRLVAGETQATPVASPAGGPAVPAQPAAAVPSSPTGSSAAHPDATQRFGEDPPAREKDAGDDLSPQPAPGATIVSKIGPRAELAARLSGLT